MASSRAPIVIGAASLERPLYVVGDAEGTALGAAALGLFALGHAPDLASALAQLADPQTAPTRVDADPAMSAVYRRQRASVPALIGALGEVAALLDGSSRHSARTM